MLGKNVDFSVKGAQKLRGRLMQAGPKGHKVLVEAEFKVFRSIVFPETQAEVPVKTGLLKSTGRVEAKADGAHIIYGGGEVVYAMIQHERLDFRHNVGKAKYVEDPVKRHRHDMGRLLSGFISSRDIFGSSF